MKKIFYGALFVVQLIAQNAFGQATFHMNNIIVSGLAQFNGVSPATFSVRPTFNGNTPYDTGNLNVNLYATLSGAVFTGPVTIPSGSSINGTPIGQSSPAAGSFTALTASTSFSAPYSLVFNNTVASTIQGKLNQIVNLTDFNPTCNGTANDNAAWTSAIATIGSTPTTLIISCPTKISTNFTLNANTQLNFQANGEILGTSGTETFQVGQQIIAGRTQVFSNLVPQTSVGMTVYPEWFGGFESSSDSSGGFNSAYSFLNGKYGIILAAPGTYSWQNPVSAKSNVALYGAGRFATSINVTATNINGINVTGVLGTPITSPVFADFNINSATAGTTNSGIALTYTALAHLENIQVNNFDIGVNMECATNTLFNFMGTTNTAGTNGFYGWNIYGGGGCAGGNASSIWRDTYVQGSGAYSGPTGQIGYHVYGSYVSDLYFDNASTAETNYGYYLDYSTATAGGYADVELHNPVVDGITTQGIFVNALPAQQMLTISDGWLNPVSMLAETDGVYLNNCVGSVQISNIQIGGEANYAYAVGVRVINSSNVKVANSAFNDNKYHIEETGGSAGNLYTGNSFSNISTHAGTAQVSLTGSNGTVVSNNTLSGYATVGITADATSSNVQMLGNVVQGVNITTAFNNSGTNPIGGGYTGSGLQVLQGSPTINTPVITGVTSGAAAASGQVGQLIHNSTSGTTITSGATVNATSLSVPAGDWDCWGNAAFLPSAGTAMANLASGIGTTSATLPALPASVYLGASLSSGTAGTSTLTPWLMGENVSSTTTLYLTAEAGSITGGTGTTVSGQLYCRRMH